MSRLNQLTPNDYPSQSKINAEFAQIIGYLQAVERGGKTLTELLALLADSSGAVRSDFIEFQIGTTHLQWRTGGGSWNDLISLASITGPAGPSGAGTGDMVRATYDPDNDGRIAIAQLNIANGDLSIAKTSGLQTALDAKLSVTVSATAPSSPTYPPSGPLSGWWDISTPTSPTLRIWDGTSSWVALNSSSASSTSTSTSDYPYLLAGEALLNRDVVFLAGADGYSTDVASGGTPITSAGTAANLTDGNDATSCDTASATGWVGYDFGVGVTKAVALVELLLGPSAGSYTYQFVFETSPDGTTYTPVMTQSGTSTYSTSVKSLFRIPSPVAARYFRIRQIGGVSNLSVRTLKLYTRDTDRGRAYKVDDDASPTRKSRDIFITTDVCSAGNRVRCFGPGQYVSNMSGLSASTIFYTSVTAGQMSSTPNSKSLRLGEARDATTFNFLPAISRTGVGELTHFAGDIADLQPWQALCDGAIVSREIYPDLFAKIGTNFGSGDGVTTFALPDLRDRFLVGAKQDNAGVPNTNLTGSLTQSGGSRTASVTTGGGGSNVTPGTPTVPLQVTLDPPYFAMAVAINLY